MINTPKHRMRPFRLGQSLTGLGAAALSALITTPVHAQAIDSVNPTREQLDQLVLPEPQDRPRLLVDGDVERAPCSLADPAYAHIRIRFAGASFNNLGPVDPSELNGIVQPLIGKEHPIAIVCDIRDAAATYLRNKGYLAAVQVPVQKIEDGTVKFEVLYARMSAVRVMGEAGRSGRMLEKYLSKLVSEAPFNRYTAERSLLLAQDLPGYDVKLSLRPTGNGAGDMVGEVRVVTVPLYADVTLQNLASQSTGRFAGQARVQYNGLTGHGDRTTFSAYTTSDFQEQQVYQAGHDMLVGSDGLRIGGRVSYALTRPDLGAGVPPVRGRSFFATLDATYPLQRTQALSLYLGGGLDLLNQRIRFDGLPLSRDRIRTAFVRLSGEAVDLKGVGPKGTIGWKLRGALEVRQGLSIFKASPDCVKSLATCAAPGFVPPSLIDGDPTATIFKFSADAELRLLESMVFVLSPRAQVSTQPLPAFEQFSLGNYTIGRGFDPGAIAGDSGVGFTLEAKHDPIRLGTKTDIGVQPYAFVDQAWVWNKGVPGGADRLTSLGGGARFILPGRARFDLGVAAPMRRLPGETQRRDVRVLATLTTIILPWRTR